MYSPINIHIFNFILPFSLNYVKIAMEALSITFLLYKNMMRRTHMSVKIVETSLRDGHQSLLATRMTTKDILSIIPELDQAGFHALEA